MKVNVDTLTVEVVHELTDAGLFPFGDCGNCGVTPVSLHFVDEQWRATCPGCGRSWSAIATNWRDIAGAKEAGWDLSPDPEASAALFDDRPNQVH